ncbi:MAG TPA: ABC transporter permease [Acidimicrobiia bacterium]|nr:ABC transporter permease [Acidimicrobiia bacterium]
MTWRDTIRTATEAVRTHRLRSALTMLGILIGITAVVLTVGLGAGAKAKVQDQINELGTNVLVVSPGSSTSTSGTRGGFGSASTLTRQDATALSSPAAAPDVQAVAPASTTSASLHAGSTNWTTTLTGTTRSWSEVRSRGVTTGRFVTAADEDSAAPVVVLGPDTVSQLFGGNPNPVGQTVNYNGVSLQVVGVLDSLSSSENASNNDVAVVPLSTYEQRLVGGANRSSISSIYVKARSASRLSAAYQETNGLLLNAHHVSNPRDADFSIATQQSILQAATSVDNTLTVMLAGIAVIALLVGGIGVMNIMLVSVAERTREIGVRKAIGARPRVIRQQFLVEASVLGLAGGVLGLLLGLLGAVFIPLFSDSRVVLSLAAMAGSLVVAVAVGIAFGVYPASRAARLAPIDALRSE